MAVTADAPAKPVTPVNPALANLPASRRRILEHLKRRGAAETDALAAEVGITPSGARQHLAALERDGLVTHRAAPVAAAARPGRPRFLYVLTPAADALFPRRYADLTNELLEYVEDEDPALLERIFDRRGRRRLEQAQVRTVGLAFRDKVKVVAQILDEDGYLADFAEREDGAFVITEHNCAVLNVALRYGHACRSEIDFLRAALPEAAVTRIAHRIAGAHVCAYEVRPNAAGDAQPSS